jgi:protein tyrosine phosphatase (PTP) superfamily phosphohydrolase (DUF442 family)
MRFCRASLLLVIAAFTSVCASSALAKPTPFAAPNLVDITPKLVTSGQPSADALGTLAQHGFEAVIYLAPANVHGAVADEAAIMRRQELEYIHIPIKFDQPTAKDYDAFASAMSRLANRKVLVHCEINLRASSLVFLYRAIVLKEDANAAYESVTKVWSPRGAWKPFIEEQLRKHGVRFQVF